MKNFCRLRTESSTGTTSGNRRNRELIHILNGSSKATEKKVWSMLITIALPVSSR